MNELFKKECRYAIEKILLEGLVPFVKVTMENKYGKNWVSTIKPELLKNYYKDYYFKGNDINWEDPLGVLTLVQKQWKDTFSKSFSKSLSFEILNYVSELIGVRGNAFGHTQTDKFSFDYTYRALDSIEKLLSAIPNDRCAQKKAIESATKKGEILAIYVESQSQKDKSLFSWHEICGVMLLQKQRDSLRRKATQVGAEVNVYVALDLLKREERLRNDGSSKPDKESKKPICEIEKTYRHDDFLESLTQRQGKNKHIAIAGEAGAGKTTLLATIAEKLHQQGQLTIFISLAGLQDKSLYDYIYDSWLPEALGLRKGRATEEQKDDLHEQFKLGKVWLLLDGLDEMQSKSSTNAWSRIEREIRDVIEQSKVVLTCRLNVWDVNLNGLSNFETFRMGKFSQDDVDKFISEWFIKVERPESAPILQAKLNDPNRDRIRDMVRHPLRLALLCQVFYRNPNTDLPETKAGLYELFVRYFYEWKPNIVDEDLTQDTLRKELHLALGKLAIAGIDGDAGFRLSRSLAVKEMDDRLFKLASDVGWLTLIERDEQDQEVYAFYHASFQEYFAALAIEHHSFLLNHVPNNLLEGSYRVFQSKWREVFLLFLGRKDDDLLQQKRLLMNRLIAFQDDCGGFYTEKSRLLAASGTREFYDFDEFEYIIEEVVKLAFGSWNEEEQIWEESDINQTIVQSARITLGYTQREYTVVALHGLLATVYTALCNVLERESIDLCDQQANQILTEKPSDKIFGIWCQVLQRILDISNPNNWLIKQLIWWLNASSDNGLLYGDILETYQKVCTGVPEAIDALKVKISGLQATISENKARIKELRSATLANEGEVYLFGRISKNKLEISSLQYRDEQFHEVITSLENTLAKIDPNYNFNILSQRYEELNQCKSEAEKIKIIDLILQQDSRDQKCVAILDELSNSEIKDIKLRSYIISLEINRYDQDIQKYLVKSLDDSESNFKVRIARALIKANIKNEKAFEIIINTLFHDYCIYSSDYYFVFSNLEVNDISLYNTVLYHFDMLRDCLQKDKDLFKGKKEAIDFLLRLIEDREDGYILAIEFIQDIAMHGNNNLVIEALIDVMEDEKLELSVRIYTAIVLNKICLGHPVSILFLHVYLDNLDNEQYQKQLTTSLLNANLSVLNEDEKSLLENNLLSILDNRTEGESSLFLLEIATLLCKIHPRNIAIFR